VRDHHSNTALVSGPGLTVPHHKASAYVANSLLNLFSTRYTRKEEKMSTRKPMYHAVTSSCATQRQKKARTSPWGKPPRTHTHTHTWMIIPRGEHKKS